MFTKKIFKYEAIYFLYICISYISVFSINSATLIYDNKKKKELANKKQPLIYESILKIGQIALNIFFNVFQLL